MARRIETIHSACKRCSSVVAVGIIIYVFFSSEVVINKGKLLSRIYQYAGDIDTDTDLTVISVDTRRRLAKLVAEVQNEIDILSGKDPKIQGQWSVKLAAVAGELDPRLLSSQNQEHFSSRTLNMNPASQVVDKERSVCSEIYLGPHHGFPFYQQGMEQEDCVSVPKISSVLTAVLPAVTWKPGTVEFVVKQIRKLYDISIIAVVSEGEKVDSEIQNVTVLEADESYDEGKTMNRITELVETPLVFMGISLSHFSNQSSLERLVRVLDDLENVRVVGGAGRDSAGHWNHGCLQQRMAMYEARYVSGYYYSRHECMYCDDLLVPFVTYKQLLVDLPFSKDLTGPALFRDWFARVTLKGHLIMACPDVMFFMSSHVAMNYASWSVMAKKWLLEKIHSYDDEIYNFDCDDLGITCMNNRQAIERHLLPKCCRTLVLEFLAEIDDFAKKNDIYYELLAGSALSAVKMGSILPWDFDADVLVDCTDFHKWEESESEFASCMFFKQTKTYLTILCSSFFVDVLCYRSNWTSLQYLPSEYQNVPTTIKYSGRDFTVSANPGLYNRNKYGIDVLKHAGHWTTIERTSEGNLRGGYRRPGVWNPCKIPEFHSCLDHYPGDGSLPFLEPFLFI
ncbi:uncharacterized protein LOC135204431 [Macrobrachium nipponense]|uniref:uncharacterized protein LOC135204431 n=1 Tax=Macrobrachium nipponense TaxID=159736 RepID=UPI0030C807FC